jgi:hypothetical protein
MLEEQNSDFGDYDYEERKQMLLESIVDQVSGRIFESEDSFEYLMSIIENEPLHNEVVASEYALGIFNSPVCQNSLAKLLLFHSSLSPQRRQFLDSAYNIFEKLDSSFPAFDTLYFVEEFEDISLALKQIVVEMRREGIFTINYGFPPIQANIEGFVPMDGTNTYEVWNQGCRKSRNKLEDWNSSKTSAFYHLGRDESQLFVDRKISLEDKGCFINAISGRKIYKTQEALTVAQRTAKSFCSQYTNFVKIDESDAVPQLVQTALEFYSLAERELASQLMYQVAFAPKKRGRFTDGVRAAAVSYELNKLHHYSTEDFLPAEANYLNEKLIRSLSRDLTALKRDYGYNIGIDTKNLTHLDAVSQMYISVLRWGLELKGHFGIERDL